MPNLVGIGLSQVPTNSMLGGMAYQNPDRVKIKKLHFDEFTQINSEIADTAVDVFVYDTRKDSDGGAWRKRTQHTSWYNETLNTSTRGSRREFPAVAVIVLISNHVIIYDGDDPDLPMWMKIPRNAGAATYWYGFGSAFPTATSIYAMNGIIAATHTDPNNSSGGVALIRFIHDNFYRYGINNGNGGTSTINISERESSTSFPDTPTGTLVDWKANDVAMTVLPNAPIDETTGLPVPTIAVATDGGVSVIKDDGTVIDLYRSGGNAEFSHQVAFDENNSLFFSWGTTNGQERHLAYYETIPSSDDTELTDNYYPSANFGSTAFGASGQGIIANNGRDFAGSDNKQYLTRLYHTKESATSNTSSVANITSDYNTGWMHGNIKGAFLSGISTATRNAETENLITGQNHDYDTNTGENWTSQSSATATYSSTQGVGGSGAIALTSSGGSNVYSSIQFTGLTDGVQYTLRFQGKTTDNSRNTSFNVSTGIHNGGTNLASGAHTFAANNTYEWVYRTFTASGTSIYLSVYAQTGGSGTLYLDEFYLLPTEEDRSVNNNGLAIYGTVTKSAVATGAELVAYSGFSGQPYNGGSGLTQPYNSDLDFGTTGEFYYSMWFTRPSAAAGVLLHRSAETSTSNFNNTGQIHQMEFNSTHFQFDIYTNGFGSGGFQMLDDRFALNTWNHVVWLRRSGGFVEFYHNGDYVNSSEYSIYPSSGVSTRDATNTSAKLHIGYRPGNTRAFNGSISLFRVGASAPSAEQVKKMYEDEKVLFQENAACTLYGSSDAVTALAYDDSTNLLYAGTSSGRSDFQGLRRINNTTTAVTTAMSASNGLVAEQ